MNLFARLGMVCIILTILGGFVASGIHLKWHHENRDEREGLSQTDIVGAYHGVRNRAPMLVAMEGNHAEELPSEQRKILLDWLNADRISEDYDNLDLGDLAPAEIIAVNCLNCHSRQTPDGPDNASDIPLDFWDDVRAVSFSREISPTNIKVLAASTHAHALSLGTLLILAVLLAVMTRWPQKCIGIVSLIAGASLLIDMAAWWLARNNEGLVILIILGGTAFSGATVILYLSVIVDLLMPPPKTQSKAK